MSRRKVLSALAGGSSSAFGFMYWFQAQASACRILRFELRMYSSFLLVPQTGHEHATRT